MSVIRTQEPTVYAQIDVTKCLPSYLHSTGVYPLHSNLHQQNQHTSEYLPCHSGDAPLTQTYTTAETPLITSRNDNSVNNFFLIINIINHSLLKHKI